MAAGQGFKTFVTGEVLTAGDVNGYLMQGINVFTNATARDAAITAPAEGQFAFTKDNNSLWYYDGSAWVASGATGDIEGVTAGVGISGGGTSGTVTITNSMATAIDAKGDLVAGTGADAFDRLAVGTNGQVLKANSATATGLEWGSTSADNGMTLISNTTTTGTSTIQITGLGSYDRIVVMAQWTPSSVAFGRIRLNNDSSSLYRVKQSRIFRDATDNITQNYMEAITLANAMAGFSTAANNSSGGSGGGATANYRLEVTGLKSTTGFKSFTATQGIWSGALDLFYQNTGIYESTSAITTIDFVLSAGTFGSTDIRVYGA
jgi:hypothetical protein